MKILFTGGGTLGPVTPLLAVAQAWRARDNDAEFVWVGTPHGPERELVEAMGIRFFKLPVARLARHPSLEWFALPFRLLKACYVAAQIVRHQKPDLVCSAGGYTAVPVILAAKLFGVSVWVHQQDVHTILTNRLTAPFANVVTAAWEKNLDTLPSKATVVGNPVRPSILEGSKASAVRRFGLDAEKPTVVVFGGGSGSRWINEAIVEVAPKLAVKANVVHITGMGKMLVHEKIKGYHEVEFLADEMADVLAAADLVVCRAGLGTITELVALAKPAVVIPFPHSPQEENAEALGEAAVVINQNHTNADALLSTILDLLDDSDRRDALGKRMQTLLRTNIADELVDRLQHA